MRLLNWQIKLRSLIVRLGELELGLRLVELKRKLWSRRPSKLRLLVERWDLKLRCLIVLLNLWHLQLWCLNRLWFKLWNSKLLVLNRHSLVHLLLRNLRHL